MTRKIRITIDLELQLLDWIEQYAENKSISRNQAVAEAIELLKNKEETEVNLNDKQFYVDSQWVRENDSDMYHFLYSMLQDFVADELNEASKDDLKAFRNGEYIVSYVFRNDEVYVTAGKDEQDLANQPSWTVEELSEFPDDKIELYKSMASLV